MKRKTVLSQFLQAVLYFMELLKCSNLVYSRRIHKNDNASLLCFQLVWIILTTALKMIRLSGDVPVLVQSHVTVSERLQTVALNHPPFCCCYQSDASALFEWWNKTAATEKKNTSPPIALIDGAQTLSSLLLQLHTTVIRGWQRPSCVCMSDNRDPLWNV